jgi:hypothetical protein
MPDKARGEVISGGNAPDLYLEDARFELHLGRGLASSFS